MSLHDPIQKAVEAFQKGQFVMIADDSDRENEGDLVFPAEKITEKEVAFMIRHTSGILCIPLEENRLNALELPQMVTHNTEAHQTAFSVSVDYRFGTTTGVSAEDRTKTIKALVDPKTRPTDFSRPGHLFPLRYREGGVLKRAGHTEAGVDLAKMAGLFPGAVIAELTNDDGSMMKGKQLEEFSQKHGIVFISIADIIRYRRKKERLIEKISSATIPTSYGEFTAHVYQSKLDLSEHFALVKGDVEKYFEEGVLVRVHSECLTGDVFGSCRCDCGTQLQLAMKMIQEEKKGIIVYLRGHEGRGIGLGHKLRAYELQEEGLDTVEANVQLGLPIDSREYGIGAQILADLGVKKIKLLTNNPAKYGGLKGFDLEIVERVPLSGKIHKENFHYLSTKKEKMGHLIDLPQETIFK